MCDLFCDVIIGLSPVLDLFWDDFVMIPIGLGFSFWVRFVMIWDWLWDVQSGRSLTDEAEEGASALVFRDLGFVCVFLCSVDLVTANGKLIFWDYRSVLML
jgi:hypothetical protein